MLIVCHTDYLTIEEESMSPKKETFTAAEKAAMKERAKELKSIRPTAKRPCSRRSPR